MSDVTDTTIRQPAGQPSGGQFAARTRAESDIALAPTTATLAFAFDYTEHLDNLPELPDYPAELPEPSVSLDFNGGVRTFVIVGDRAFNFWQNDQDEPFSDVLDKTADSDWDEETVMAFDEWGTAVQSRIDSLAYGILTRALSGDRGSEAMKIASGR